MSKKTTIYISDELYNRIQKYKQQNPCTTLNISHMCKKTIENILDDLENKMKKKYYCLDCNYKSNNWYAMINHAKDNLNHTITSNGTITVDQNLNLI